MKTTYKKLLLLPLIIITAISLSGCGYNTLVTMEEQVDNSWAQVENQYQRRADLIPNLVNTVKGYAEFEKSVLTEVTEARSKVSQMQINADDLSDPEKFQQFQNAQDELSGALSRLLVTVEAYPDLKANQNFLALQAQLEGTENRIAVERMRFNDAVRAYNTEIRSFPTLITAGVFGFKEKQYFKSKEGSDEVPEVDFNK
ncbi:MAG TPA: LemA family protein [Ignavibacteria bacterium]|nr:LemA family protein [Ignavibacteria bacterium]